MKTPDESNPHDRFAVLIDHLQDHLAFLKEEGAREVETSVTSLGSPLPASTPPPPITPAPPQDRPQPGPATLEDIAGRIAACRQCRLCEARNQTVPGQGAGRPDILFVGEGPGGEEDLQGLAFVGKAGQLLTKMIEAMGYTRDEVFIGNIVKCRPPNNRAPSPDEMEACMPYLKAQIALLKPRVIVALGATSVKGLLQVTTGITKLRGSWLSFEEIPTMPTFHPAYLLRNPSAKREVWEDLQEVLRRLGKKPPGR